MVVVIDIDVGVDVAIVIVLINDVGSGDSFSVKSVSAISMISPQSTQLMSYFLMARPE